MTSPKQNPILTIRLNDAEQARFWRLMDAAKERSAYAGKSDILRELLGLNPPSVLTTAEINFFRTGKAKPNSLVNGHISPKPRGQEVATSGQKLPLGNAQTTQRKKTGT